MKTFLLLATILLDTTASASTLAPMDLYAGPEVAGKAEGEGLLYSHDGGVYLGDFIAGKKEGYGLLSMPAHSAISSYEGFWRDDQPKGTGTVTYRDGRVVTATWNEGDIKSSISF